MQQSPLNIVHVAVGLLCVVIMLTIAVVVSNANRRTGPRTTHHSWQLRGIHQGMVTYANSNKDWYPGINREGLSEKLSVEDRYQILLEGDYFTPEYAISPAENNPSIHEWNNKGVLTANHYSFAMLQVPEQESDRRAEWSQTLNTQAIVVSDRNTGTKERPSSIHLDSDCGWAGNVLWNDNHVEFGNATSEFETKYGGGDLNEADRLFESDGANDALMVHTGN